MPKPPSAHNAYVNNQRLTDWRADLYEQDVMALVLLGLNYKTGELVILTPDDDQVDTEKVLRKALDQLQAERGDADTP